MIFNTEKLISSDTSIFLKPYIETAAKVGIESKKDIFAASNLSNCNNLAAVIAIPDLLTPGTNEAI